MKIRTDGTDTARALATTIAALAALVSVGLADGLAQAGASLTLIPEESSLTVSGTSSLHDWSCEAREADLSAELADGASTAEVDGGGFVVSGGTFRVPTAALRCGKGPMDKNLRRALDAEEHPEIVFELTERVEVPDPGDRTVEIPIPGRLEVAGASRRLEVTAAVSADGEGRVRIQGEVAFDMSDFGVEPPTAMLGMLKTDDRVSVHFDLALRRR